MVKFGWLSPVIGNQWSDFQPIVIKQCELILPEVAPHFDSVWIADHFYGFDARSDPFLEAWTTLTWVAAKFPNVDLCHHVLGHGYRPPALTAKMASTLQVLSGNRFTLGIGAGWREEEYLAYGYDFPKPSIRFKQLEEVVEICRLMWSNLDPSYEGNYFKIDHASAPPLPDIPPRICIGAAGEKIGLPLAAKLGDGWNTTWRGKVETYRRKRDIVLENIEKWDRSRSAVEFCLTIERALPTGDADSQEFLEFLNTLVREGVDHFVLDFGNPDHTDDVLRFIEQVMGPLRKSYNEIIS